MSKSPVTRRSFLGGTLGASGLLLAGRAVGSAATGARAQNIPVTREEHRVVIVGSGFGGSVAALRLAEAGVNVTLLERGLRWPTGPNAETFPRVTAPDKRALWYSSDPQIFGRPVSPDPYLGLLDAVVGENMTVVNGSGLGGGSLVYQGMSLQPSQAVFETNFPLGLDWTRMNQVHFPRVSKMLKLAVAPDELIAAAPYAASRVFARNVTRVGLPLAKVPMPIDWSFALAELRGEMKPAYINGDLAFGVNNGGKNSLDVTYIAAAEATGRVDVRTQHNVTNVELGRDGRWIVYVDFIDTTGRVLENKILTTKSLIMGAGSTATTSMLVRAAALGSIPDMPDELGRGWGTNGDRIYNWINSVDDYGPTQGGPVVYGSRNWSDPAHAFSVNQASIPPLGFGARATIIVGMGISKGRGHFAYNSANDRVQLHWPQGGDDEIQNGYIDGAIKTIVGPGSVAVNSNQILPNTWHPAGGACLETVCDLDGRVHGHSGLYVLDGALLPGTAGACNPSMTIAAIAERAMDNIVANDVGTVI